LDRSAGCGGSWVGGSSWGPRPQADASSGPLHAAFDWNRDTKRSPA